MVEHVKYIRKVAQTEPLKSGTILEGEPGPGIVTDEALAGMCHSSKIHDQMLMLHVSEYVKNSANTCFHAIGSLSMMPRDKNGVVDSRLKVRFTYLLAIMRISQCNAGLRDKESACCRPIYCSTSRCCTYCGYSLWRRRMG